MFIVITVALSVALSWQSFNKTSDIMLRSADDLYGRITQEFIFDFKATYGSLAGGLRQFRLSPVIQVKTFPQCLDYLPSFQVVLESDASVFVVGVGYADGDYLGFSSVNSDYVGEKYIVPAGSSYLALYIKNSDALADADDNFAAGHLYAIFYDDSLKEVSRYSGEETRFDPRLRPWYQQATDTPHATKPYLFYDSKIVGLTAMSKTAEPGVVVVFDVTLKNRSNTIAKHQVTDNSEVVLLNAQGQVFAYKNQQSVITKGLDETGSEVFHLAKLEQLGSGVLSYLSTFIEFKESKVDFEYKGQRWIGSTSVVAKTGGTNLYALMLSPVNELLVDAYVIRQQLVLIAFFILLMFIPVIWYAAKKISAPLHILSKEAEAISRFDFDETQKKASFIKEVEELDSAMDLMRSTINKFIKLINSLAGEQDLDALLKNITQETMLISQSDAALIYLLDEQDDLLKADFFCDNKKQLNTDSA